MIDTFKMLRSSWQRPKPLAEIFEANHIKIPEAGCWIWYGSTGHFGHGVIHVGGKAEQRIIFAHRLAWELYRGPIPEGMQVNHRCDVSCCVNPAHLYVGTQRDNMRDKRLRGRSAGAGKKFCKHGHEFTPENTSFIRKRGLAVRRCLTCHSEWMRNYARKRGS